MLSLTGGTYTTSTSTATVAGEEVVLCNCTAGCSWCALFPAASVVRYLVVTPDDHCSINCSINFDVRKSEAIQEVPPAERYGWAPPVRQWHRCRIPQMRIGRSICARQPRGRVRTWRSLKDKRRAWGIT